MGSPKKCWLVQPMAATMRPPPSAPSSQGTLGARKTDSAHKEAREPRTAQDGGALEARRASRADRREGAEASADEGDAAHLGAGRVVGEEDLLGAASVAARMQAAHEDRGGEEAGRK